MKINRDLLLGKINLATKFISNRISSSTALQGIFLKKEKNKLFIHSTNLNSYYKTYLKTEGDNDFEIVVEPKKISEFLSLLLPGEVDFMFKEKNLVISQQKNRGIFPIIAAKDFPLLKKITSEKQKINIKILKEIFPIISFAASVDETRPVLTGVNFVGIDEITQIVATDGFRLSLYNLKTRLPISSVIIPSSFLSEVLRIVEVDEIEFSFEEEEKVLTFYVNEDEFSTRLIEGEYPPYQRVIPKESTTQVVLDKDEFLRNVKLVSVFAREFSNIFLLEIEKNGIKFSPKTNIKEENISFQEAEIKGEPIKIAFNSKFLIDFLSKTNSKKIKIELLRPDSPTVFKMVDNNDFLHIIMPVRVQD